MNTLFGTVPKDKWRDRLWRFIQNSVPLGWTGTGEDIRIWASPSIGLPPHHNHWGVAFLGLIEDGFFSDTGSHKQMRTIKSHGRRTTIWRRV